MDNETVYNFTAENMDEQPGFSPALLTFAAVLTFIIMIVGIFGNFLTVVALLKCPKVRNVAAAFIISLCMADLIFCALVLPFSALRFIEGTWTHGDVLCKLIPFIQYGNIGVSLLCIGMITINRYVMIAHHSSYAKIYKKQWIAAMIAFCWLFSYGMQLPTLLGAWGVFDYDPRLGTCSIMTDAHGRSSKTTLFIIAFVIPCLIIIACYAKIFWVVHESEARLKKHANKQNSIPNNQRQIASAHVTSDQQTRGSTNVGSESSFSTDFKQECVQKQTRIKDQRDLRAKRNEWRITKMVLAIFLSFVVCYLPITLAKVVDKNVEHPTLHILGYIMLYLSACINPIIYVIMNKQYRKAYQTVILCEPARLLPFGKHAGGGGGGSSAAEKWKDIGSSNNHSRTMVSQMSAAEQQSTSFSHSQPGPSALEMTAKSAPAVANSLGPFSSRKPERANSSPSTDGTTFGTPRQSGSTANPQAFPAQTPRTLPDPVRIALAGGDIILEEEEDAHRTEAPKPVSGTANGLTEINLSGIGSQKKIQSYGQNINAIPDNNLKLMPKIKL